MSMQLADTVCIPCRKESAYMHAEDISSAFVHVHGRHRSHCMLADLAMQVADIGRARLPHWFFSFAFLITAGDVETLPILGSPLNEC
jgi:hypothetical protein